MKILKIITSTWQFFRAACSGKLDKDVEELEKQDVERYCLGILTEECGETLEQIGKSLRFGIDSPSADPLDPFDTPRYRLSEEVGGLKAVIRFIEDHETLDYFTTATAYKEKIEKLYNQDQRDNLGRPLAPQPKKLHMRTDNGHTTH